MRTLFFISALALCSVAFAESRVSGAEGRVQESTSSQPDEQRVSGYSDQHAALDFSKSAVQSEKKHAAAAQQPEQKRAASMPLAEKASWYRIFDAGSFLRRDRDGDGHHSEFEVRFDADSLIGDARVYAKLYLRRVGDTGGWQHYHTTDDFWIFGQSGTDDYYVKTAIDEGFPTGDYDVLIDLYESGYSGIVATLTSYDDSSLASLPLEERALDIAFDLPGYAIHGVDTTLLTDDDRDGFYSRFKISFDPDTDLGPTTVYAIVWIRAQGGTWIKEHESDDFIVDPSGSADAYSITADWVSGYPTARYDVQLDLHDAATGLLIASAGSERPEFSRIPLEDQGKDRFVNAPVVVTGGTTTSHEHGGGSLSMMLSVALFGVFTLKSIAVRLRRRREVLALVTARRARR